jgi:hypothetical protein
MYDEKLVSKDDKILSWFDEKPFRATKKRINGLKILTEKGFGNKQSKIYKMFIHNYEFTIPKTLFETKKFIDIYFE